MENNNKVNYLEMVDTLFQKALLDRNIKKEGFAKISEILLNLEEAFKEALPEE